jgi:site-specific recombinase XerD
MAKSQRKSNIIAPKNGIRTIAKSNNTYLVIKSKKVNNKKDNIAYWIESYTDLKLVRDNGSCWSKGYQSEVSRKLKKHLLPIVTDLPTDKLRYLHLRKALLSLSTKSEQDSFLRILHGFLSFGIKNKYTNISLEKSYKRLSSEFKLQSESKNSGVNIQYIDPKLIPTDQDVENLVKSVSELPNSKWYYPLIFILAHSSGLRLSEVLDLDVTSVDISKREISITSQVYEISGSKKERGAPKYNISRVTVFPNKTSWGYDISKNLRKRVLEAKKEPRFFYGSNKPRILLFPAPRGGWWSKRNFTKRVRIPAQSNANWPLDTNNDFIWSFHSLRHAYAKNLIKKGHDLGVIANVLGYKTPTTLINMYFTPSSSSIDELK